MEKIELSPEELARAIGMLAQREGVTIEVAMRKVRDSGQFEIIAQSMLERKVIDFLAKEAAVTEVKA